MHEHAKHAKRTLSAHKLEAKWSVPYRVIGVSNNQVRIRVQSLLSWDQRIVHRSEVRTILPPHDVLQSEEWRKQLTQHLELTEPFASESNAARDARLTEALATIEATTKSRRLEQSSQGALMRQCNLAPATVETNLGDETCRAGCY